MWGVEAPGVKRCRHSSRSRDRQEQNLPVSEEPRQWKRSAWG